MKLNEIIKKHGYKNDTVRICEYLGFSDTEQLKAAKFFAQIESYSPIPFLGVGISNNDCTWKLCSVVDEESELFSVDYGYKITLTICDGIGCGNRRYYQCDFLSLLKHGCIIYCSNPKQHVEHTTWYEPFYKDLCVVHEADVVVD